VNIRLEPRINYVASQTNGEATGCSFDLTELAGEVAGRVRDGRDPKGGPVPNDGVIEFGDGDIEAVAQLFFERAHDLTAVLEGLRVLDGEFEGERGERHECEATAGNRE
jgi:hypothetical protein